jgi:hypothetical protein
MNNDNSIKQIVWVFGASAAGKATFINYVTNDKPLDLLSMMGWQDKTISAEPYSLSLVGQTSYHDSNTRKRFKIIPSVISKLSLNDVVLIKGQQVDLDNRRPQKLKSRLADCRHSVLYLDAGVDETGRRMRLKPWWNNNITADEIAKWQRSQIKILKNMDGFDSQILESSRSYLYSLIKKHY